MYVIPVAYYVVKPDGSGLQQQQSAGPRIEVVGNQATLRQQGQQQNYYYDQNSMQRYQQQQQQGYYQTQGYPQQQQWGGYSAGYGQQQAYPAQTAGYYPQQGYYQQPQNYNPQQYQPQQPQPQRPGGGQMMVPVGQPQTHRYPSNAAGQQQMPPQNYQQQAPQVEIVQQQQRRPVTPTGAVVAPPPGSRPPSRTGPSRTGSLERQRQPSRSGEIQVEIPDPMMPGAQGPHSTGSLPPSYGPSPRHREFREAMEQPVGPKTPPPRQLFELPWDPKKEPNPPQHVRHVHPKDLVPPQVIQMYAGKPDHHHQQQQQKQQPPIEGGMHQSGSQPQFSRSGSLRRSQQQLHYDDIQRRRGYQANPATSADIAKSHLSVSRENLGPKPKAAPSSSRPHQHYAEPNQHGPPGVGPETAHLVRHIPPEEASRLPSELFEEKPKWQPMRPDKFSIFGKEAAYPPFPVIGPRYMLSVSGGAKFIEIILSICCLVLVTIICDRGRCFPRSYNPMATEVVMWIVSGLAIVLTVFLCVPYVRKKPLSPKAYYRFLLVEVFLNILGAISYFVASICLLVVREGEIIGYLIETWVCSAALGLLCGILYVCSTVFSWLALQRATYYLHFLRYASHQHKNTAAESYRMSVAPTQPPSRQSHQPMPGYSRPPTAGMSRSGSASLAPRYN